MKSPSARRSVDRAGMTEPDRPWRAGGMGSGGVKAAEACGSARLGRIQGCPMGQGVVVVGWDRCGGPIQVRICH